MKFQKQPWPCMYESRYRKPWACPDEKPCYPQAERHRPSAKPPTPTAQDRIASALERIADALEAAQQRPPSRGVSLN